MRLQHLRIRNYRTIHTEQSLTLDGGTTLVGVNNAGKTNILRAIEMFFTGPDNAAGYVRDDDLTHGIGRQKTSLIGTFARSGGALDDDIFARVDELYGLMGRERADDTFPLALYFTDTGTPVYQLFPGQKQPKGGLQSQFSRQQRELVMALTKHFVCHYVPAAKSISSLYNDVLGPFLIDLVAEDARPLQPQIEARLRAVEDSLSESLIDAGLADLRPRFTIPGDDIRNLLGNLEWQLEDPLLTPITSKGQGIQATTLLASFIWVNKQQVANGHSVIWLIEEPESYLHPRLAQSCLHLLDRLAEDACVVTTTHDLSLVPQDVNRIAGVDLEAGRTRIQSFANHRSATAAIRSALGVQFSDFYNLGVYNVFLEGPTDVELLAWVLEKFPSKNTSEWPRLRNATLLDYGGVTQLEGFLKASFEFIRAERPAVAVFDGDSAGEKSRRNLQGYFGNKQIPFQSGQDFISVRDRFSIEGLFPDPWLSSLYEQRPAWFAEFSTDAAGAVEPFRIKDEHKRKVIDNFIAWGNDTALNSWGNRFRTVCNAIEGALAYQEQRIVN